MIIYESGISFLVERKAISPEENISLLLANDGKVLENTRYNIYDLELVGADLINLHGKRRRKGH